MRAFGVVMLGVAVVVAAWTNGCGRDEAPSRSGEGEAETVAVDEGVAARVEDRGAETAEVSGAEGRPQSEVVPTEESSGERAALEEVRRTGSYGELQRGQAVSAPVGSAGGTLRSGDVVLEIPPGAMPERRVVTLEVPGGAGALERPLPSSPVFGGIVGGPWNLEFRGTARLSVPVDGVFPPGQPLQLLAWQPGLMAYTIIARAPVDSEGARVVFPVARLGRMVLRPEPERVEEPEIACGQRRLRLRESVPDVSEDRAVGLVDPAERIARADAFAWLVDFRIAPGAETVGFKNEEVRNSPRTRRDERNHQDEDFLMDPNLSAAVAVLGALVRQQWRDPLSGVPAFDLRLTEAYDSFIEHSERSTHYQGRAGDLTLDPVPGSTLVERRRFYGQLSALAVCAGFDWVLFEDAFHAHASVVPTRMAWIEREGAARYALWERRLAGAAERVGEAGAIEGARALTTRLGWPGEVEEWSTRTVDGLRELVVADGRLFWRYADGQLPPASRNADDVRFAVEPVVRVDGGGGEVLEAWLRPHVRTAAWSVWLDARRDGRAD
ncbi:MAG: hypothetical protein EA398_04530 [Deltaproteobacteria bacterium]|nr:MAG: hypothetical protein EA398_04530 [Deltaproteobacteria bacterium]